MVSELYLLGYGPHVYTKHEGKMAGFVRPKSILFSNDGLLTDVPDGFFEFAFVNHSDCHEKVPENIPTIFTSHGLSDIEHPARMVNCHVAVSEEIAAKHGADTIIRNGVDCHRFRPRTPAKKKLETVLYLSHPHYKSAQNIVREACSKYGVRFLQVEHEMFHIERLILQADLVIGFGRGLLESMACGRNVLSADWREYYMDGFEGGGMVTPDNFDTLKQDNFTGRMSGQIEFDADSLCAEFEKYDSERGEWLRERVLDEFNIEKTVQEYLMLGGA